MPELNLKARMSEAKRNLITAGLICGAAVSVVTGIAVRERVDLGPQGAAPRNAGAILASRTFDPDITEAQYFEQMQILLKREYVEPITDELKLANGAVRGMIVSLEDERCIYLDDKAMRVYENALKGKYEGICADLILQSRGQSEGLDAGPEPAPGQPSRLPRLAVASVVPGGPADKAGVKAGDWVESIDGRWVINADIIDRVRMTQQKVRKKEWPAEKLEELRLELKDKENNSMMPYRAYERLIQGTSGALTVVWHRGGALKTTKIVKGGSSRPSLSTTNGTLNIRFLPGVDSQLRKSLKGKTSATIDLRGAVIGDANAMEACLAVVAPNGNYGTIVGQDPTKPNTLKVSSGPAKPIALTLIVDSQTRGAAEIFARALKAKGVATIQGGPMAGDASIVELQKLPAGSGYTLVTGIYQPPAAGGASK